MTSFLRSILVTAALLVAPAAMAGDIRDWDAAGFAAAQTAGTPVLIHVTAPWCPTCRAQKPVLEQLAADPANDDLLVFEVDFDSRKDVLRGFGVRQQSTLIAFKGATEVARSVGVTSRDGIAALVAKTK